jgi:hypothetical protein
MRRPSATSTCTVASSSTRARRTASDSGSCHVPPSGRGRIARALSPTRTSISSPLDLFTWYRSASTSPLTSASPRPKPASIDTMSRRPLTGSAVNRMPETSGSTMRCTTTLSFTPRWPKPLFARYNTARSVKSDTQQRRTASSSAGSPRTLRNVSCWPAKLAPGRSSAVALERTAHAASGPLARHASSTALCTAGGTGKRSRSARMLSAARRAAPTSCPSRASRPA